MASSGSWPCLTLSNLVLESEDNTSYVWTVPDVPTLKLNNPSVEFAGTVNLFASSCPFAATSAAVALAWICVGVSPPIPPIDTVPPPAPDKTPFAPIVILVLLTFTDEVPIPCSIPLESIVTPAFLIDLLASSGSWPCLNLSNLVLESEDSTSYVWGFPEVPIL